MCKQLTQQLAQFVRGEDGGGAAVRETSAQSAALLLLLLLLKLSSVLIWLLSGVSKSRA
jgi:hypothetical protein